jgi:hippurate hydrolase
MEENTNLRWRSTIPGRFHGCGHDSHTTMLLGTARYLAETHHFDGTVHFIFQPAEEASARARHDQGRLVTREFPYDGNLRAAQCTRSEIMARSRSAGTGDGRRRLLRHRHHRIRRAWRDAELFQGSVIIAMTVGERCRTSSRSVNPHEPAVLSITQIPPAPLTM